MKRISVSVYRRSYHVKRADGARTKRRSSVCTIELRRHGGPPQRVRGYEDKAATVAKANDLKRALARGDVGLVNPHEAELARPIREQLEDWVAGLEETGKSDSYCGQCRARVERLVRECGWITLADINGRAFERSRRSALSFAAHNRKDRTKAGRADLSPRTRNHYLATLGSFIRWCLRRGRLDSNPLSDVDKVSEVMDVRRARRSLTPREVGELLTVATDRHALVYRLVLGTGLRREEVRQLRWRDLHLDDAGQPRIELRASITKSRRADSLPLRRDLAAALLAVRADAEPDDRVFAHVPTMKQHRRYLAAAGVPWCDADGRRADFHALRTTFASLLSRAGVSPARPWNSCATPTCG